MGCWTCILACPHGAITRDRGKKVVAKCDFCPGRDEPACVANCPNEALMIVEENELEKARS
jgi:carbon-monoxide dehydrogenase iron sulfur subunit